MTTTTTVAPPISLSGKDANLPRSPSDFNVIKNHANFNLLNEKSCGVSTTNRIVGGIDGEYLSLNSLFPYLLFLNIVADLKEFPWAVLLGYQLLDTFEWGCGGSLISSRFVLTAAVS